MELKNARLFSWIATAVILAVFIHFRMLKFLVFLLFMSLVTDLAVNGLGSKIQFISKRVILYTSYLLLVAAAVSIIFFVVPQFVSDLPVYIEKQLHGFRSRLVEIGLPVSSPMDYHALKEKSITWFQEHISGAFDFIKRAGGDIFMFIIALVLTFLIANNNLKKNGIEKKEPAPVENLLDYFTTFITQKISNFYSHFKQVMGAQVIISLINTTLTIILLIILGIPHKIILGALCFIFGLIPVVGNLISNTLICLAAFIWSGNWQTVLTLIFLVVIHKLEYFLNGKIIGHMVKLPMSMALLALLVGESVLHISGMILAIPTLLFIREEMRSVRIRDSHLLP
jgi:predicted PurR-regulated permease PerM